MWLDSRFNTKLFNINISRLKKTNLMGKTLIHIYLSNHFEFYLIHWERDINEMNTQCSVNLWITDNNTKIISMKTKKYDAIKSFQTKTLDWKIFRNSFHRLGFYKR